MSANEHLFRSNLQKFQQILPEVALKLQYVDVSDLQIAQTRAGEINLLCTREGKKRYYHSNYNAQKEAETWFKKLQLQDHVEVLYIYGVGAGHYYDAVKTWLGDDPGRYVVFLEDDLRVLRRLMETEKGTKILDDRQVQLHFFPHIDHCGTMMDWITWYFLQMHPEVAALDLYQRERGALFYQLRQRLLHDMVVKEQVAGEYMRFGKPFFSAYFNNILYLPESYHGPKLFGQFKGVPAIVCGAGPSLNKNVDLVGELMDRALVFCGGSSLNAVTAKGILPHFSAGIDPNPPQQERLMSNTGYEVPFFYRQRMYHRAFRSIHGPRLFLNGTGGYKISEFYEERLGIQDKVCDEGYNVINLSIDIARLLGCNPIILVGMDLAYTDMKSYASGVVTDEGVNKEAILNSYDLEGGAFLRKDVYGKDVYTLWKWVSESEWIGSYAKAHPETQFFNCTEGGIGFPGVEHLPLKEVVDQHLSTRYELWDRVHGEIQNAHFTEVTEERVLEVTKELRDSLKECQTLLEGLLGEMGKVEELVRKGKSVPHNLQTGKAALYDTELCAEDGYIYVLGVLGMVHAKILERRMHQVKHDWRLKSSTERNLKILEINKEKCQFLLDACQVVLGTMDRAVQDYGKKGFNIGAYVDEEHQEMMV